MAFIKLIPISLEHKRWTVAAAGEWNPRNILLLGFMASTSLGNKTSDEL